MVAAVSAIVIGEAAAWWITSHFGIRNSPFVVGFVAVCAVAGITSVIYKDQDIG